MRRVFFRHVLLAGASVLWLGAIGTVSLTAAPRPVPASVRQTALPADATGEEIFRAACVTCHGPDGTGSPPSTVTFETPRPDFADCAFATAEADLDWFAVVHEGGTIRGLDHRMPAFGDALSSAQIVRVVDYLRGFCGDPAWPRGDLNLPRAFFTEKAFPENEAVWTIGLTGGDQKAFGNEIVYERRIGSRNQVEAVLPFDFAAAGTGQPWAKGVGDVAFAFKHTLYSSMDTGAIAAAGAEWILPTGNDRRGLGSGTTIIEPFAMWGLLLPEDGFLQLHGGMELPHDTTKASRELYLRTAVGKTFFRDRGYGRAVSPQIEMLVARPTDGTAEWDLVPQVQVSLSKLQHVMMAAGVRIPLNGREERSTQFLSYILWDWYDGSFFDFWK